MLSVPLPGMRSAGRLRLTCVQLGSMLPTSAMPSCTCIRPAADSTTTEYPAGLSWLLLAMSNSMLVRVRPLALLSTSSTSKYCLALTAAEELMVPAAG